MNNLILEFFKSKSPEKSYLYNYINLLLEIDVDLTNGIYGNINTTINNYKYIENVNKIPQLYDLIILNVDTNVKDLSIYFNKLNYDGYIILLKNDDISTYDYNVLIEQQREQYELGYFDKMSLNSNYNITLIHKIDHINLENVILKDSENNVMVQLKQNLENAKNEQNDKSFLNLVNFVNNLKDNQIVNVSNNIIIKCIFICIEKLKQYYMIDIIIGDLLNKLNDKRAENIYFSVINKYLKDYNNSTDKNHRYKLLYYIRLTYSFGLYRYYQKNNKLENIRQLCETAVNKNIWKYYNQRPEHEFISSLKSQPFLEPASINFKNYIESQYQIIVEEYMKFKKMKAANVFAHENSFLTQEIETWKEIQLGSSQIKNREYFPNTCSIIEKLHTDFNLNLQMPNSCIKISVLKPTCHIIPHCGNLNTRVRVHLGLIIPDGCYIRCDKTLKQWEEGKILVLDDSYEHEVWNWGDSERVILIIDIWHPNLSLEEIEQIKKEREYYPKDILKYL